MKGKHAEACGVEWACGGASAPNGAVTFLSGLEKLDLSQCPRADVLLNYVVAPS